MSVRVETAASSGDTGEPEQQGRGAGLAGRVAAFDQAFDRARGFLVDTGGGRGQRALLVHPDDEAGRGCAFRRVGGGGEIQGH